MVGGRWWVGVGWLMVGGEWWEWWVERVKWVGVGCAVWCVPCGVCRVVVWWCGVWWCAGVPVWWCAVVVVWCVWREEEEEGEVCVHGADVVNPCLDA